MPNLEKLYYEKNIHIFFQSFALTTGVPSKYLGFQEPTENICTVHFRDWKF